MSESACQALEAQFNDPQHRLTEYAPVHLRCAKNTVDEHYRNFHNPEPLEMSLELHLNLESISLEFNVVETDVFKHPATITHKPIPVTIRTYADA